MARNRSYATLTTSDLQETQSMDQLESPTKKGQIMFYRVASQRDPGAFWRWESRVIASLEVLMRVLWMYRSMSRYTRRVFFASSVAGLDSMLDRETKGLASHSIPVEQLLQKRWSTSQRIGQLEMRQFESELRTRESVGLLETSTVGELTLHEERRYITPEGSMDVLDRRRLEFELGPGGDHAVPYRFVLPTQLLPSLVWMKLLARIERGELQP